MSKLLKFAVDAQGYATQGLEQSDNIQSVNLVVGSERTFTVPSTYDKWLIVFQYPDASLIWVSNGSTAVSPPQNDFAAGTSQLNPAEMIAYAGDVISCKNSGASDVAFCASLYPML